MRIRNIIFDLGGVIIDIDYTKTIEAFRKHGAHNIDVVYSQSKQDRLFDTFDIGKMSSTEFRRQLQEKLDISISDDDFDSAWNAMLLDLPMERLSFIMSLRESYGVYLFSNTNDIHLRKVFEICRDQNNVNDFSKYFIKEYYSHQLGMRKPNKESFLEIVKENRLIPSETLFIDDSLQHVLGARDAGLHAVHLTGGKSIFDLLDFIKQIEEINEHDLVLQSHSLK